MASHLPFNTESVDLIEKHATDAYQKIAGLYDELQSKRAAFPDVIRKENLDAGEAMARRLAMGNETASAMLEAIGPTDEHLDGLQRAERNLDFDRISRSATFLPSINSVGESSQAMDLRRIAERYTREDFARALPSFSDADWQDTLSDIAAGDPVASPSLAKLAAIQDYLSTRTDSEASTLRAAVSATKARITGKWGALQAASRKAERARIALRAADHFVSSAKTGSESSSLAALRFRMRGLTEEG